MVLVGCTTPERPQLSVPATQIRQTHFLGNAVSGPQTGRLGADLANGAMLVDVQLYAATELSTDRFDPVGAAARLVLATRDRQPAPASGELTGPVRWAASAQADEFMAQLRYSPPTDVVKWQEQRFAVPKNATGSLQLADGQREIQLLVSNNSDGPIAPACEVALGISQTNGFDNSQRHEQAVFRPIAVGDGVNMAIVMPFQFPEPKAKTLAIVIRAEPAPVKDDAFAKLLERSRQDVEMESDAAAQRMKDLLASQLRGNWPGFEAALLAAADAKTRRNAMVYLASQTGADLSRDCYLVADDAALEKMLAGVAQRLTEVAPATRSDAKFAAVLEISTLQFLGKLLSDNQLPPELGAVLTDYAGEAGRHPGSIEQISSKLTDRKELDARLIVENRIYLEDNSPASRVRAYDWLKARGQEPKGFDPLASPRDRREALAASSDVKR